MLVLFKMKNRSAKNMLNNNEPSAEPRDTPKVFQTMYYTNYLPLFSVFCLASSYELILKQVK